MHQTDWQHDNLFLKGSVSLLQPTLNSVELCKNYENVTYVLYYVKFKSLQCPSIQIMQGNLFTF